VPLRPYSSSPPGRGVGGGAYNARQEPRSGSPVRVGAPWPENPCPDTTSAPCESRRRSRGRSVAARRRHGPRAEAGDRAGPATAFENGRLKIARGPPPAGAPVGELRALQVRFSARVWIPTPGSREHDDLVMAVAMARGSRRPVVGVGHAGAPWAPGACTI